MARLVGSLHGLSFSFLRGRASRAGAGLFQRLLSLLFLLLPCSFHFSNSVDLVLGVNHFCYPIVGLGCPL